MRFVRFANVAVGALFAGPRAVVTRPAQLPQQLGDADATQRRRHRAKTDAFA